MPSAVCRPRKSKRTGLESDLACGPMVGGKNKRTGAVCSWSYCQVSLMYCRSPLSRRVGRWADLEEDIFALIKIQSSIQDSMLAGLVLSVPAAAEDFPLGVKLAAYSTRVFGGSSGQKHGERVVSGSRSQFGVSSLIEFDGRSYRLLGQVGVKLGCGGGFSGRHGRQ